MVVLEAGVPGLSQTALRRFVAHARRAVGLRGTVNVLVTSNLRMQYLNRRFRAREKPTDVLSFPSPPSFREELAGDIAISAAIAAENAKRLGHSAPEEIKILALHGILHLSGYDHEIDNGRMARRERHLRRQLGLPLGLIERSDPARPRPGAKSSTSRDRVRRAKQLRRPS